MEEIILSVLCDNMAAMKEGIRAEHGFSAFLEWGDRKVLFDTGQSDIFWHNAEVMGCDVESAQKVLVSHGHYDHTGGLGRLARPNRAVTVIAHPAVFTPRYKKQKDGSMKYIGCPYSRDFLESRGLRFSFVESRVEVVDDVFFVCGIPQTTDFEKGDPLLMVKNREGEFEPDPFLDDAAMYARTPEGLVIVLGCSHRGVINILRYILTLEGDVPILTIIGGTHLSRSSREQREETIDALRALNPRMVGVSHCTGTEATDAMRHVFGQRFFRAMAGVRVTINQKGGSVIQ